MIDAFPVPDVESPEVLARYILQGSHVRRSDGTVKPDAFVPHPHRDLSVTRHLSATENELWSWGSDVAAQRQKTLHGRADLTARDCLAQNLVCSAAPLPENPNHANISAWPADKPLQKMIALEIASTAQFVATPPI